MYFVNRASELFSEGGVLRRVVSRASVAHRIFCCKEALALHSHYRAL
jgi:hypothetical protein